MEPQQNDQALQGQFIALLEVLYGTFNSGNNSFELTSNSKIARDLFYSDSQFSRLINGTASQGEFERAVRNVERSIELKRLREQPDATPGERVAYGKPKLWKWVFGILVLGGMVAGLAYWNGLPVLELKGEEQVSRFDLLQWSFENKYIKPYVKLKELPDDCNFPCYKYQGKWSLKHEYKIPFFRERNGFHYVAKEARMYANCLVVDQESNGEGFEGYEYQKHEIWYDRRELPIDSFLMASSATKLKPEYIRTDFDHDPNFVKIANLHTFFRGEYIIDSSAVDRTGKVIGRDLEFLPEQELLAALGSEALVDEIITEVNAIAQNRLQDFSKPISCNPSELPKADFHMLEQGDEMRFDCRFQTGRFLVDYTKVYTLEEQYINNMCR